LDKNKFIHNCKNKIINFHQIGGIETSILNGGSGRGTHIAWVNTGTGLRYKIVIDRAMDIAEAFYNQTSLTWLSFLGVTPPDRSLNYGVNWLKSFGGGLLTTCGLIHVGGPEIDEYGVRGLHGEISNIPAEVESIIQPDPTSGNMNMSITGRIKESKVFGPNLELRRTISGTLGNPVIKISDQVINHGNESIPHMFLYHFNFGWPLVDDGTDLIWHGKWQARSDEDKLIFNSKNNFKKVLPPLDEHSGNKEAVAFIDITPNKAGICTCGLINSKLGLGVLLRYKKKQLPWLTNWQHWGKKEYVTGLEPGTNPPIGQSKARKQDKLIHLDPGESRRYEIEVEVVENRNQINKLLKDQEQFQK
jgi:hypothetical protein